jgi:hypothetical protein
MSRRGAPCGAVFFILSHLEPLHDYHGSKGATLGSIFFKLILFEKSRVELEFVFLTFTTRVRKHLGVRFPPLGDCPCRLCPAEACVDKADHHTLVNAGERDSV